MDKLYPFYIETKGSVGSIKSKLLERNEILVFFDGRHIVCENQIQIALYRAFRSKKENKTIAKQFNIEVLLHLSGTHQIKIALDLYDLKEDSEQIIILQTTNKQLIENSVSGFPNFTPNQKTIDKLKLMNDNDPCKGIISRGARFILDHE
ncbi:MAG: hypothetical protein HeimC2_15920 [Candidatus Heimdallarchaeota archaeon LC_2]|nr:MAG: hypothetical protein HeimC2_15920 [Candidatus Heimdallarchaeota archaeon LC_2]